MKISAILLPALLLLPAAARGDYALPPARERLVLLLNLDQIRIDAKRQAIVIAGSQRRLPIDRFWMQDRIWSDGICVGVRKTDPKSAHSRVEEVAKAISQGRRASVLLELVRLGGNDHFIVTYLKLFDAAREYARYYPKRQSYDTIEVGLRETPEDSKSFVEELKRVTRASLERLAVHSPRTSSKQEAEEISNRREQRKRRAR